MDFSKASLEKNFIPDTFYVDDSSNNQKNNDHQRRKPDKGDEDGKDLTNKKYNQLHQHFLVSQHDIKPVLNTDNSVQENDLVILGKRCEDKSNQLKTPKAGHPTTFKTECQKTLASCSNFYEKKIKNQLSDNARLTDDDLLNKNTENLIVNKRGHCQIEVEDEEETIEKIAEMIGTSSNGAENSTKGKKRLQELTRKSYSEQQNTSSVNIDPKEDSLPEGVKDICYKENKYDNIKILLESREAKIPDKSFISNEKEEETEKKTKKSRFEEIEDKLEEMFAGIEDEKLENVVTDKKDMLKRISEDSVVNYIDVNCNDTSKENYINVFVHDSLKYDNSVLLQTKAAKKSTSSILINEKISPILNQKNNQTISNSAVGYLKTMHKRDSINMEISNDNVNVICNKNSLLIKDKLVTPQPLNSESNKVTKKRTKYVRKTKIKNNRNKCSEFKKDTSKKIIRNRNYKKNSAKSDVINKSTIQQKIKQNISSENENDERLLPAKDCETKHRSPFILVKNNGSIAVINTIATDDSNEKWSRTKKTSNYVYERKTVKGCHSSTLSNRYDADTADSSWICVLCKIGPHKKRLGDLFGPYVITSDCDEYRSVTEFIEKIQTRHGADTALTNFSNKSIKCLFLLLVISFALTFGCVTGDCKGIEKLHNVLQFDVKQTKDEERVMENIYFFKSLPKQVTGDLDKFVDTRNDFTDKYPIIKITDLWKLLPMKPLATNDGGSSRDKIILSKYLTSSKYTGVKNSSFDYKTWLYSGIKFMNNVIDNKNIEMEKKRIVRRANDFRNKNISYQSLCPTKRVSVPLETTDFEYRPNHYTEVSCAHTYVPTFANADDKNKICSEAGFSCMQLNRTIHLIRRNKSGSSECWESEIRVVPSGCECMWPKHYYGDILAYHESHKRYNTGEISGYIPYVS